VRSRNYCLLIQAHSQRLRQALFILFIGLNCSLLSANAESSVESSTDLGTETSVQAKAKVTAVQADCLGCHKKNSDAAIHAIWKTVHGNVLSKSNETCIACHGTSSAHGKMPTKQSPTISFGPKWASDAKTQSESCLNCHQKKQGVSWLGSAHHDEDLSCASCHSLHTRFDKVLDKEQQPSTCFNCHKSVQSKVHLQSRHPILEGRTTCSDCHNPHGTLAESLLKEPTLNDSCYSCHSEKRGPFLFEHAPVTEDCSTCHNPHGSVNNNLLSTRSPFLCQQCHSAAFHPSQQLSGASLPNQNASAYSLGKNCLNCHSQIHGSNHPSGSRLTR